ncbi:MAG: hypothetical protein MJZ90_00420 [Bacteroidales bacterium]|nr:hypothetical protein [Bacteroidales bacterium]
MEINFKTIITFLVIFAVCGFWMTKCTYGGIENAGKPDKEEVKSLYKSYSFKAVKNSWMSIGDVAEKLRIEAIQEANKAAKDNKSNDSKKEEPEVKSLFYYKVMAVIGNHDHMPLADRETILISFISGLFVIIFLITSGIFLKVHSVKDISFDNFGFNFKNKEE